jgi:regulator of sigma D
MPKSLTASLNQADRCLQANANIAACVMFDRALEALCRDHLEDKNALSDPNVKKRPIMLSKGIQQLRTQNIIDDRLYDWSEKLQAFRNLAAHPDEDFDRSREDTEDLQAFAYAITEYVYHLTDRYNEFNARMVKRGKMKPKSPGEAA